MTKDLKDMSLEELTDFAHSEYSPEAMAKRGVDQDFADWKPDDIVATTHYEYWKHHVLCVYQDPDDGEWMFDSFNREGKVEHRICRQYVRMLKARPMITTLQAADILGVTQRRVQALIQNDKLHPAPQSSKNLILLDEQEVRNLASAHRKAGRPRKTAQ